jgi:hypothetical protein
MIKPKKNNFQIKKRKIAKGTKAKAKQEYLGSSFKQLPVHHLKKSSTK